MELRGLAGLQGIGGIRGLAGSREGLVESAGACGEGIGGIKETL